MFSQTPNDLNFFLKIKFKVITLNSAHKSSILEMTRGIKRNKSSWENSSCNLPEAVLMKQIITITSHSPPDLGFNYLKL